ncbi:MAG: hypothetical protein HYV39_00030 [Candidatus Levybacteria bacterium]|nr:hypothetical protein [Candidatus Levybacteria bacterium]
MADIKDLPRDAEGRFVGENVDPITTTKTTLETSGPINIVTKPPKENFDEPLLSVKVQNPFKKLLHWLNEIRKKQTTTFDFKIKIPLLALPIFFAVLGGAFSFFFNLGQTKEKEAIAALPTPTPIVIIKPTATPAPVFVSRMGTIKATYQVTELLSVDTEASSSAETETPTPIPSRFVLVKNDDITFLVVPPEVSLNYYLNKRVLISGWYDKLKDTLSIAKSSDIEILP